MYFWSALIGFGALAYSVNSASMWIVLGVVVLSAVGLVLLLLPRFTPRVPVWAQRFVPPRYRRRRRGAHRATAAGAAAATTEAQAPHGDERTPVTSGASGVNGATAVGTRSRFLDRR
jgi:UDP-GlcNAc:undecaprenyl-phosphate GlcNAc-1-phosphate transferase